MDAKYIARFEAQVDRSRGPDACHPYRGARDKDGYGHFNIGSRADGTHRSVKAHRLAFLLAYGHWPEPEGCHSCDVRYPVDDKSYRLCCNAAHIFAGTHRANMTWMAATGRSTFGERSGNTKLTEVQVRALLALRGTMSQREAAALFGLAQTTVGGIWRGKRWRHVTGL